MATKACVVFVCFCIYELQGAAAIILHHKNSLPTALIELFPNIGLDESKLKRIMGILLSSLCVLY